MSHLLGVVKTSYPRSSTKVEALSTISSLSGLEKVLARSSSINASTSSVPQQMRSVSTRAMQASPTLTYLGMRTLRTFRLSNGVKCAVTVRYYSANAPGENKHKNVTSSHPEPAPSSGITEEERRKNRERLQMMLEQARQEAKAEEERVSRNSDYAYYLVALAILFLGVSYLAVPLYAAFCQMTGFGGTVQREAKIEERNNYMRKTENLGDVPLREVTVKFEAHVHPSLNWDFYPCQKEIKLRIGETSLAFFKAKNLMNRPFIGVSAYNVLPPQAGIYFNKIQCFCFDEQRLNAGEELDMPLFFFLDPAMADDWRMDSIDQVTLTYTFFPAGEDIEGDGGDAPRVPSPAELIKEAGLRIASRSMLRNPAAGPSGVSSESGQTLGKPKAESEDLVCPPMPMPTSPNSPEIPAELAKKWGMKTD